MLINQAYKRTRDVEKKFKYDPTDGGRCWMVLVPGHSLLVIVCPDFVEGNGGVLEASCYFCGLRPTGTMNFQDMSPDTDSWCFAELWEDPGFFDGVE